MIGRGCNYGVGPLKEAQTLSCLMPLAMNCWTFMCIFCHQYWPCSKLWLWHTPKCFGFSWTCHTNPICWGGLKTIFIQPSSHVQSKQLPSYLNLLALCRIQSFSLLITQVSISPFQKLSNNGRFSWTSLSTLRSIITLGSLNKIYFLLKVVIGASIALIYKKVEACHLGSVSSSISPCHLA